MSWVLGVGCWVLHGDRLLPLRLGEGWGEGRPRAAGHKTPPYGIAGKGREASWEIWQRHDCGCGHSPHGQVTCDQLQVRGPIQLGSRGILHTPPWGCLLYTSDAADE